MADFDLTTIVVWTVPQEITDHISDYDGVNVYRASTEDGHYTHLNPTTLVDLDEFSLDDTQTPVSAKSYFYYLVRFHKVAGGESTYYAAFTALSPREQRLGVFLKGMLSPFVSCMLTDYDIAAGLAYGLKIFNEVPVQTTFNISNLPVDLEPMVLAISGMFAFIQRYTPIALTDIGYSDNGLTLTVDRGAKIKQAIDVVTAFMDKYITKMKWNYMEMGSAAGTIPLPLSLGGKMSSSILNILDIFNVVGR